MKNVLRKTHDTNMVMFFFVLGNVRAISRKKCPGS